MFYGVNWKVKFGVFSWFCNLFLQCLGKVDGIQAKNIFVSNKLFYPLQKFWVQWFCTWTYFQPFCPTLQKNLQKWGREVLLSTYSKFFSVRYLIFLKSKTIYFLSLKVCKSIKQRIEALYLLFYFDYCEHFLSSAVNSGVPPNWENFSISANSWKTNWKKGYGPQIRRSQVIIGAEIKILSLSMHPCQILGIEKNLSSIEGWALPDTIVYWLAFWLWWRKSEEFLERNVCTKPIIDP